jgi:hypothetical protein
LIPGIEQVVTGEQVSHHIQKLGNLVLNILLFQWSVTHPLFRPMLN